MENEKKISNTGASLDTDENIPIKSGSNAGGRHNTYKRKPLVVVVVVVGDRRALSLVWFGLVSCVFTCFLTYFGGGDGVTHRTTAC